MSRVIAAYTKVSPVAQSRSWSLPILRLWLIQAKVRSATHLLGRFSKDGRFGSLLKSMSLPSLNHSLAQTFRIFSGGGLGVRFTTSTSTPNLSSAHSLPLPR